MSEHMHEWIQWDEKIGWYCCKNQPCHLLLSPEQTLARINATERLNAENATYLGGLAWESSHRKEKKSQEPMLEDSEMQVRLEGAVEREKELMRKCIAYAKILEK